jgi:hypothetical protein
MTYYLFSKMRFGNWSCILKMECKSDGNLELNKVNFSDCLSERGYGELMSLYGEWRCELFDCIFNNCENFNGRGGRLDTFECTVGIAGIIFSNC